MGIHTKLIKAITDDNDVNFYWQDILRQARNKNIGHDEFWTVVQRFQIALSRPLSDQYGFDKLESSKVATFRDYITNKQHSKAFDLCLNPVTNQSLSSAQEGKASRRRSRGLSVSFEVTFKSI